MSRNTIQVTSVAALGSATQFLSLVPAAAANFKVTGVVLGVANSGGAITDFDISVGVNRGTARGTATAQAAINKADPNAGTSVILPDITWSIAPTFGAATTDGWTWSFNSRGGLALNFNEWDIISTVGTANPLVFINRSGAALPAAHSITATVSWLE